MDFERWCKYCRISWDVRYNDDDTVIDNSDTCCPNCDSDDAQKLDEVRRAVD